MKHLAVLLLVGAFVAGCSSDDDIQPTDKAHDEAAAIAAGRAACTANARQTGLYSWHAEKDGDHWNVWSGPKYDGHAHMEVQVSRDGAASDCEIYAG